MAPSKDPQAGPEDASLREVDALRVDLGELELGTHPLAVELPAAWVAEILRETDALVERSGAARLELMLQADRTVLVRGRLELSYAVPCARCLEPAPIDVGSESGELCVTYIPADRLRSWAEYAGAPEDEDEIEPLDASELDEIGYEGNAVDLRGLIGEQILLAYPMRALCERGEACGGLCPRCGANLNAALDAAGRADEGLDRCPGCSARLTADGAVIEEDDDSPWKRALSKVELEGDS